MSTTQREAARAAAVQVLAEQERLDVIRAKLERGSPSSTRKASATTTSAGPHVGGEEGRQSAAPGARFPARDSEGSAPPEARTKIRR